MASEIPHIEGTAAKAPAVWSDGISEIQETGDEILSGKKKNDKILMGTGAVLLAAIVAFGGYFAFRSGDSAKPGTEAVVPGPDGDDTNVIIPATETPNDLGINNITLPPAETPIPTGPDLSGMTEDEMIMAEIKWNEEHPAETTKPQNTANKYTAPTYDELAPLTDDEKARAIGNLQTLFDEWMQSNPNNTYITDISLFRVRQDNETWLFNWQLGYVERIHDSQGNLLTKVAKDIKVADLLQ